MYQEQRFFFPACKIYHICMEKVLLATWQSLRFDFRFALVVEHKTDAFLISDKFEFPSD